MVDYFEINFETDKGNPFQIAQQEIESKIEEFRSIQNLRLVTITSCEKAGTTQGFILVFEPIPTV